MLYAFIGTDTVKASSAARAYITSEEKRLGIPLGTISRTRYTPQNWSVEDFESIASGAGGLFGDPIVLILDGVDEVKGIDMERVATIAQESSHVCVYIGNPEENALKSITGAAKSVQTFETVLQREDKSNFELADYIGKRDKKTAWLKYRAMIDGGASADEIHGTIFWLFKNMKLASEETAVASGLHSFVYGKAQANAKKFSKEEINERLQRLISMHVRARSGEEDMEAGIERFILCL
ncbi:MAG TPA: hypothetical protein PLF31_02840 [Candidatus Paceibacterota bacterium]|nr:hypothetical protein [Candidatus Paceibacterota bacterium]